MVLWYSNVAVHNLVNPYWLISLLFPVFIINNMKINMVILNHKSH